MHGCMILDDGTVLEGQGFGYPTTVFGEAVFNTGMVGYTETLTDPSYGGQILAITYPLVGNYGIPNPDQVSESGITEYFESDRIQVRGLVVQSISETASHWSLEMTLDQWLHSQKIPGISGIDTRSLTKSLRISGVRMAALAVSEDPIDVEKLKSQLDKAPRYGMERLVEKVSVDKAVEYGKGRSIVVIDAGIKNAILRNVVKMGYKAVRVPYNTPIEEILSHDPVGVILSNGPGDPQHCPDTINTAKNLIHNGIPTLGICLGAQIIGLAGRAQTYKLKYGHRGQNKSCLNVADGQVYVTSQNHGYAIDTDSLADSEFDLWFINTDDNTVEGIRHKEKPCIAVQFHPEASPGPYDCEFVFAELQKMMEGSTAQR